MPLTITALYISTPERLFLLPTCRRLSVAAMASAAHEVFAEHLGVIQALRDNYARTEDANAVAGLVRSQQEVAAACSQREDQVKETIKGDVCWPYW